LIGRRLRPSRRPSPASFKYQSHTFSPAV
jgi:hypothetical protein